VDALGSERPSRVVSASTLLDGKDKNVYSFFEVYRDEQALAAHQALRTTRLARRGRDPGGNAGGHPVPDRFPGRAGALRDATACRERRPRERGAIMPSLALSEAEAW
jgi:hypothetical protein